MSAERIAILKYNMTDMRTIHENDFRETKNFDRKRSNMISMNLVID